MEQAIEGAEGKAGQRTALIRLMLAILAISLTPVLYRGSVLGPAATSFYRTALALPVFLIWLALEEKRLPERIPQRPFWLRDGPLLILGGLFYAGNILAYAWAVRLTQIANASLLSNLTPIFVALASFILFGERVRFGFLLSMLGAILGVGVLSGEKLAIDQDQILGDGLGIISSIGFAAYLMVIGRLGLSLSSAAIMFWASLASAAALLAAALLAGEPLVPASLGGWGSLFGLGVVSYALGQGLLTLAMTHIGATFSAVALLSLPVSAACYGWLLLGEALSIQQMIGGAIILVSILGARLTRS